METQKESHQSDVVLQNGLSEWISLKNEREGVEWQCGNKRD
jgi:hypothetical protein